LPYVLLPVEVSTGVVSLPPPGLTGSSGLTGSG